MPSDSKKWKSRLLSSSLPLEYEAANMLVSEHFSVTSDYSYTREESGIFKEFSVDILARGTTPFHDPNKITSDVSLLVECKYRHPKKVWLFIPDPNMPDYSPITLGITIRAIDHFSAVHIKGNSTIAFDSGLDFAYKAVEIDLDKGDSNESDIRHGIAQLRYSLPTLIASTALLQLGGHKDDNVPFFICPILLTTAPLYLAKSAFSIEEVKSADEISDVADEVDAVILFSDYGPDFRIHTMRECQHLGEIVSGKAINEIQALRESNDLFSTDLPFTLINSLIEGQGLAMYHLFNQFVVVSMHSFDRLLGMIKKTTLFAIEQSKQL